LNLPPEVLESLAYSNYYSPHPRPIDPAVFFDLVKIRRLIDDATSLAVRAANGTTSAALSSSLSATNGILGSSDAEILGLGSSRGGGHAKLSRERKHRMREHATQKLAHAYRLDEIAASVSTMQSASALEEVAKFVLQREQHDPDAQYVHFFHEKIPSRALAASTTLDELTDIINKQPTEAATYRTRAVTRIFKDDFLGAARDLTEGLAVFRLYHPQHQNEQRDLILAKDAAKFAREYSREAKVDERDQPSSLEPQFLFHRGNTYLTLACEQIVPATASNATQTNGSAAPNGNTEPSAPTQSEREEARARAEARKLVRTYAKRALRDYLAFLGHFDYTPGLSAEYTEAFLHKVSSANKGHGNRSRSERLLDVDAHSGSSLSDALVKYERQQHNQAREAHPQIPKPKVHKLNALFAAVPPSDLPPYPPDGTQPEHPLFNLPDFSEAVTYHPLLTDVLHSLLLCHCLIQTSSKELMRHAYMAARLARVCDGYPIFLAARSPARADWIEILRRSGNFLQLESTWEKLCAPAPLPGQHAKEKKKETAEQKSERIKRQAIEGALGDERVVDEETFRKSVRAREMMAAREEEELQRKEYNRTKSNSPPAKDAGADSKDQGPKRWAQGDDGKEYPITTERAEAIVRWIREAPPPSSSTGDGVRKKKPAKGRVRKMASQAGSLNGEGTGLEHSVESLDLVD
jgi:hypothetical protein